MKIFETYKKHRPASSYENRIVKTLYLDSVVPQNYPTAGINNAYLDIGREPPSNYSSNKESEERRNTTISILKEYMPSEEPIDEEALLLRSAENEGNLNSVSIESKKEEGRIEVRKDGNRNNDDFQEKYTDNISRWGELGTTREKSELLSGTRKEIGLSEDDKEGSGMHIYRRKNELSERNGIAHERNTNVLEYGTLL